MMGIPVESCKVNLRHLIVCNEVLALRERPPAPYTHAQANGEGQLEVHTTLQAPAGLTQHRLTLSCWLTEPHAAHMHWAT